MSILMVTLLVKLPIAIHITQCHQNSVDMLTTKVTTRPHVCIHNRIQAYLSIHLKNPTKLYIKNIIQEIGGFHLVAKIIRELKSHMIPYKFKCSHWCKFALQPECCNFNQ